MLTGPVILFVIIQIPIIKEAETLRNGSLKLFASAWTAPLWMKNNQVWVGYSTLQEKYGQVYAEYLKKFLDAYVEKGIKWWGISTGSHPFDGFINWQPGSMGWIPEVQVNIFM